MDMILSVTVKVTKYKLGPFEHAQSMSKWSTRSVYIGNIIYYLAYLSFPFHRGLEVDKEGSRIFSILILSMHINRLGLFSYLY